MSANAQPGKGNVGARRPIITPEVCDNDRAALTANEAVPATAAKPSRDLTASLIGSDPA